MASPPPTDPPSAPSPPRPITPKRSRSRVVPMNKDVLYCDICLELYNDTSRQPKFLSCHHSYCRGCLLQVANGNDTVECPSCRQVTQLSTAGVPALQTNFYISQLQDTLRQAGAEMARGCKRHLNQPMAFFCTKCCILICRDCTVLDHKVEDGHVVQDVTAADPEQRDKLKVKVTAATQMFEEIQSQLGHIEAEAANLSAAREETTREITAACERYVKMVDVRRTELLKQTTDEYNKRQAEILHNAEAIGTKLKKLARCLSNAERLTRRGPLCDVLSTGASLEQMSHDLRQLLLHGLESGSGRLRYEAGHGEIQYQASLTQLGRLVTENAAPPGYCFCTGEGLTAGLEASVTVQIQDSESGQPYGHAYVDIMITDRDGDRLQRKVTWDGSEGTISFVPQISGEMHFYGTYRGRVIQASKHSVTVRSNDPISKIGDGNFHSPRAVAMDAQGSLYVADTGNRMIQKVDKEGALMCKFEIGSPNNSTCDVALTDDLVVCTETVVSDINNPRSGNTVLMYDHKGELRSKFNNKSMKCGLCVATNQQNEILVSDFLKKCIYVYDHHGNVIRRIVGQFNHPAFICTTKDDDRIIVTDTNAHNIQIYNREGVLLQRFGRCGTRKGELTQPFGVATDGEMIVVADSGNHRLQVYTMDGRLISVIESAGDPLDQPRGITLTDDGHVYVADRDNHCIKKYRYK